MIFLIFFNGGLITKTTNVRAAVPTVDASGRSLRIATANVLYKNNSYGRMLQWVQSIKPDALVLVENTSAWDKAIGRFQQQLPHAVVVPADEGRGLAVYSRYPIERSEVLQFGDDRRTAIYCAMTVAGRTVNIVAAHPQSPLTSGHARDRDTYLADLTSYVRNLTGPLILVGDLNTTPWSHTFEDLVLSTRSTPAAYMPATWPSYLGRLGIPIDHILVRDLSIKSLQTGPRIGSDHFPLVGDIAFN